MTYEKVKALICVGGRNEKLKSTFSPYLSTIYECESMEHAVKAAYYSAERDDVVLLSSACETMFADREQVSRMFRKATSEL